MDKNKILDLRFVIGVFFTIVGLLLLGYSFISDKESIQSVNSWCGVIFSIFGVSMIILSFVKDADDELIEDDTTG
jgi:putative Mn2+ efflux pump MntP